MNHQIIACLRALARRRNIAGWAALILGSIGITLLAASPCIAQTTPKPTETHLRLVRNPTSATIGTEVQFTIFLTAKSKGISNRVVLLLFDGKEIHRGSTDGGGQIPYLYRIPNDAVPASAPNESPNKKTVQLQAIYGGDLEFKGKKLTSKMTISSRRVTLTAELPRPTPRYKAELPRPTPRYKLEVSDAVFYDSNTVVKYYGSVSLEARLTKEDKGVNGKTVTFKIPNSQGGDYFVRATTDSEGYARKSLPVATWLLVGEGPWPITASALGATGDATLSLQKQ